MDEKVRVGWILVLVDLPSLESMHCLCRSLCSCSLRNSSCSPSNGSTQHWSTRILHRSYYCRSLEKIDQACLGKYRGCLTELGKWGVETAQAWAGPRWNSHTEIKLFRKKNYSQIFKLRGGVSMGRSVCRSVGWLVCLSVCGKNQKKPNLN